VRLWFADWVPSEKLTHPGDVAFPVVRPRDRAATSAALSSWLARGDEWKVVYALASGYLMATDTYDRDRLLRLFAWFEAIPPYKEESGISRSEIDKLAKAAGQKARELSIGVDTSRIKEVLGELKRVPLKKRMTLAVGRVRARFGGSVIPAEVDRDCLEAVRLRNLAAHGSLATNDFDFPSFARAIDAVQMVCFLSMLLDLELSEASGPLQPRSLHPLMSYDRRRT
jgi:hypothetical protein